MKEGFMLNLKRISRIFLVLVFLLTAFLFIEEQAISQTTLVTVEGTVTDEDGTALPGVSVTVRNMDTGYAKSTVTREDGRFLISGLQPGKYECEVSLSGFGIQIRRGMSFAVGARLTLDFQLKPAVIEEELTVTAEAPMVEVTKSEVSTVVAPRSTRSRFSIETSVHCPLLKQVWPETAPMLNL